MWKCPYTYIYIYIYIYTYIDIDIYIHIMCIVLSQMMFIDFLLKHEDFKGCQGRILPFQNEK